jgi:hypothetical protein
MTGDVIQPTFRHVNPKTTRLPEMIDLAPFTFEWESG